MADDGIPAVSTRLRRTTPYHDAYTVRVHDERFAALATARPADARRWVATTRWLHRGLHFGGHLVVGLGVQWTPTFGRHAPRGETTTPVPATLQLCVGHRCLVFHLARADAVPEALRRFLADARVTFVGSGAAHDARMLWEHYGLAVARRQELRAVAGMGNASVEQMAGRFLGYPGGICCKPRDVAMSAWHAPRLSMDQVQYAAVDAYLAFRLGVVLLCRPPARAAPVQRRAPAVVNPAPRALAVVRAAPAPDPAQRAPAVVRLQAPAAVVVRPAPPLAITGNGGKTMGTHGGMFDDSDTESEMESYDDVYRAATRGLPVRAYASDSDSDYSVDSSDVFVDVRFGVFTDEEDEEEDEDCDEDDQDDDEEEEDEEEGCNEDDQDDDDEEVCKEQGDLEDEESCNEQGDLEDEEGCNGQGDLEDEEGCNEQGDLEDEEEGYTDEDQTGEGVYNGDDQEKENGEEEGYDYTASGAGMDGSAELVGCEGDLLAALDDWYDQEVDYGFDQDDEQEFEEFYLL